MEESGPHKQSILRSKEVPKKNAPHKPRDVTRPTVVVKRYGFRGTLSKKYKIDFWNNPITASVLVWNQVVLNQSQQLGYLNSKLMLSWDCPFKCSYVHILMSIHTRKETTIQTPGGPVTKFLSSPDIFPHFSAHSSVRNISATMDTIRVTSACRYRCYVVRISAACERPVHTITWSTFQQHVNQAEHRTFQQHVRWLCGPHFSSMRRPVHKLPGPHFSSMWTRPSGPHFGSMRNTNSSYNYLVHISAACEPGRASHIWAACAGVMWSAFQQHDKDQFIQLPGPHFSSMWTRPSIAHFSSMCRCYVVRISAVCED